KLGETNNLIQCNSFAFRNFENFKKQISTIRNIKKERTKFALSRS
ncbi:MAG: ISL3 family transposase, partial [Streptococcus mitis]|nr:ISL3 family transposase [Streptococcus mitis]